MNFESLVSFIEQTHERLQQQAFKAVNISLTIRNWLIGFYIVEFEQKGEDRAVYGEKPFKNLAKRVSVKGLGETSLKLSRQFYTVYPELRCLVNSNFKIELPNPIRQLASDELDSKELFNKTELYYRRLVEKTSFSHFIELMRIQDPLKRSFYESSAIKGTWSVRCD
ncbi:hypothetical protein E3A20_08050 [Planctomyces bekefii]|uniref:YhcG N-terminal domain-containing protein n=1 Tax=Planctomyces bekefii TaxID=1653850 RepID=A0A5C6M620_9PLAN|nr:hypothetical protein E3A20_08050 [Planctomyces bekefii]